MNWLRRHGVRWILSALIVVAIFGGLMRSAAGAIAIGGAYGTHSTSASSLSWSATLASGSNRVLTVRVTNINSAVTVTSVTWGGTALTLLGSVTSGAGATDVRATIYYLVAPAGTTNTVVVNLSGTTRVVAGTLDFTGVSQITPFGPLSSASGTGTAPSFNVAASTGDVVSDLLTASGSAASGFAAGGGQSMVYDYTGTASTDSFGAASTKAGSASTSLSYSYSTSSKWALMGVAVKPVGPTLSGTVFEDKNYGGGAGRSLATSAGAGVTGATVELYNGSGGWLASTTTAAGGGYSFVGLAASSNYYVRVVSGSVNSTRTGGGGAEDGVLTWRSNASSGSAVAVTDYVGGTDPALVDAGSAASGAAFNTSSFVYSAGLSGTAQAVTPVSLGASNISGLDFGFNFDTVSSTRDTGAGSLRQAITNANALGGDASLAQSGRTAAVENLIFMISNGTTGSGGSLSLTGGLRTTNNFFSGGVATLAPLSALPTLSTAMTLEARAQPGWSSAPIVELNGSGAGASTTGLSLQSITGATVAGLVVRNFGSAGNGSGIGLDGVTSSTIAGNYIGTNATGTAAAPNAAQGINLWNSSSNTIGGTSAADRNVISGNGNIGIVLAGSSSSNVIRGNYVGLNSAGTGALANGTHGIYLGAAGNTVGGTAGGAGNVISGNTYNGIILGGSASNTTIQGNTIGLVAAGTTSLANGDNGITVFSGTNTIGGTTAAARNVISGNGSDGVEITVASATGNTVQGNYIGTDAAGTTARANGGNGVYILSSAASNSVGGTAAGAGNLVYGNTGSGVRVDSGTGNAVLGNSIYGNGSIGIDLAGDGATANDGAKTTGQPNLLMDAPVFTSAVLSGGTLTVAGYVGSAANQSAFATSRVEVFKSDNSSGAGSGQTYLGFLAADASGNFSGSLAVSGLAVGDKVTATATDTSNNSSEFGTNATVTVPITVSGTVFEDVNYGGGAGRDLSGSGGVGVNAATVELYNSSGTYVSSTTTAGGGAYSFAGLSADTTYFVRVVNSTVRSTRAGSTASLVPVMTYRAAASSGSTGGVTAEVGGLNPAAVDAAAGTSGTSLWTQCATEGGTCSFTGTRTVRYGGDGGGISGSAYKVLTGGTACSNAVFGDPLPGYAKACYLLNADYQSLSTVRVVSASIANIDFGLNFDTVVNTNDTGQGSLRQAITNANTLTGDASLAQSGRTAAIENLVFMIGNGTGAAGLRSSINYFSAGVATIAPASALPVVSSVLVVDAQTQPGWAAAPIIELNGAGAGAGIDGLVLTGGGSTVRGLIVNRFPYAGVYLNSANNVVQGCYLGTNAAGTAASANGRDGVYTNYTGHLIGGTTAAQRNVISGNSRYGVVLTAGTGSAGNHTVSGNYIGVNAAGTAAIANASVGVLVQTTGNTVGGSVAGAGNLISGNGLNGVQIDAASTTVQGNLIGTNAAGTAAIANASNGIYIGSGNSQVIGGTTAATRNVISGNASAGIFIWGGGTHTIQGNYIGTSADGASAIGNAGYYGVEIYGTGSNQIGGTAAGAGNVISGQSQAFKGGIYLSSNSNIVQANKIGTNAAGSAGLPNAGPGIGVTSSAVNNTIGGTAAGAGNTIAFNGTQGVVVFGASATGNLISRNAIYSNTTIGIDIAGGGVTANNGTKNSSLGNSEMDKPVFSSATLSGSNLTVVGYVGSAAGQATFANATVEVFKALADGTGYGQGQTYLGTVTANASGNFSSTIAVTGLAGGDSITATATDATNNTSEFALNTVVGVTLSGTVFEDVNYGGGAGRTLAASSGVGLAGATVELYDSSFAFVRSTTTAAGGGYSFTGLAAGYYTVRVVNSTVRSSRTGSTAALVAVQTFRSNAIGGSVSSVTDDVGGTNPVATDATAGAGGTSLWTFCAMQNATCSFSGTQIVRYGAQDRWATRVLTGGTACNNTVFGDPYVGYGAKYCYVFNAAYLSLAAVGIVSSNVTGLNFGFNFDTVVNTNDSGQGSLRQAMTNANTLGGDASLAQSGRTAAIENLVFMLSNGTAAAGLRSTNNYFSTSAGSYNVATIAPTSALPSVSAALVIDAQTQPGWTLNPIIELNGASAGSTDGLKLNVTGNVVRGLVINRFTGDGINLAAGSNTVTGNWIGTNAAGTAASANTVWGIEVNSNSNTIGGSTAAARNVISGNGDLGIYFRSGSSNIIQGNYIGTNAAGTAAVANVSHGVMVHSSTSTNTIGGSSAGQGNLISGNGGAGVWLRSGSGGNIIRGNIIGLNAAASSALPNARGIQIDAAGNSNRIGGTAAGDGNIIASNTGNGIAISGTPASAGNAILGNSIYGNGVIGIDLGTAAGGSSGDGITVNTGAKTSGQPNLLMNYPVFTSATLSGTTLTLQGYVGSAAGQSTFASSRVEVFVSDNTSANGSGQTYVGFLTTDASGNFSGPITVPGGVTLTAGTTRLTGTATDTANNTSEFGPNYTYGLGISGTVFEDVNYGGGAGRSLGASGGVGLAGATVELYNSSGTYVSSTTTASGGTYSFNSLASGNYAVRVAGPSVVSQRSGASAALTGVMTYRTNGSSGSAVAVTDFVGGTSPALVDPGAASSGATLNISTGVYSAGLSGTAQALAPVTLSTGGAGSVDFGFNFDTVVNTNDTGQGSLRQAITNANTLGGDASLAQSGRTAAIENLVFMIGNGSSAAGLRSANNSFGTSAGSYTVATITLASALPPVTSPLIIDAQTQPGWTLEPRIEINGNGLPASGFVLSGGTSTLRGFVVNRLVNAADSSNGLLKIDAAGGNTVQGNWFGVDASGATATTAQRVCQGVVIFTGSNQFGGAAASARNVVSNIGCNGVLIWAGDGNVIEGNHIGTNAAGSAALANVDRGILVLGPASNTRIGGSAAGQGNVVSGNAGSAADMGAIGVAGSGGGTLIQGNKIGLNAAGTATLGNGGHGIYVAGSAPGVTIGGTTAGAANVISGHARDGVSVVGSGATGVAILGNSIYGNGGQGIDLADNGATANDGAKTTGQPNLLMDAPVFTAARARGAQLTVSGYIGTAAGQSVFASSRVEVFVSDSSSSKGSGQTYLGALTADASGNFSGTVTMPFSALRAGSVLTSTATDTANNTSEFGTNFSGLVVDWLINNNGDGVDANPGDGLCETSTAGQCTLRAALMEANAWPGTDFAAFALPSCPGAGCIITPASVLPTITGQLTIDGQTQPGWTAAPLVDLRGEGAGAGSNGLTVNAASSIVRGLAVGGFLQSGIVINANNVTVEGVHAGIAPDGATARANGAVNSATGGIFVSGGTGIVVGGTTATTRNVLSGNGGAGIWINGGTATVIGNYIGTDSTGSIAVRNRRWGVQIASGTGHQIGGAAAGQGNVISGNSGGDTGGIVVGPSGVTIQGNTIGLNAARTATIANGDGSSPFASGIDLRSTGSGHLIGGTGAGEGNVIAGNQGYGVRVQSQTTRILGNSITNNLWLGIDLNADGVTANNGTTSGSLANNDMDHPVITSAGYDPTTRALTATGYVGTGIGQLIFAGARVELFTSDGDATGYGEGSNFVGFLTVDATGRFSGTVSVPVGVTFAVGTALTGTATDTSNNTSEFGPNYVTTTMGALAPSRFNAFETSTAAGSLTGVLQTRVAGVAGNIAVIAIDNSGAALQTSFAGTVTLEWMNATNNTGALDAGNCRASWLAAGSAGSTTFVSGDLGRRTTSVTPATVGREWRLRMSYAGPAGTVQSCSTDAFAVRPDTLAITGVTDADDATAGTARVLDNLSATGGRVHRAGRPFSLRAAARDAASAVAAGYDGTPVLAVTACVLPAGCTAGSLSAPALVASAGLMAADTLSYSEVGAINLQLTDDSFADVDAADTALAQRRIQSSAVGVGRFVPDRYLLTATNTAQFATQQGSCAVTGQGFTYVGQNFGWATAPAFTLTAQNAAGATTALWSGTLQKVNPSAHIARTLAAANAQGLTPVATWGSMALTDAGGGVANVALSGDQFLFSRDAAAPVASFNPIITLGLAVSDASEAAVTGNSAVLSTSALVIGSGTGIAFNQGSNFHYARLKLQNAFGDVRRGVRANVELQKFSTRGWLRLSEDNTCLTVPLNSVAYSAGSGAFATDVCTAPATAAVALRQGRGTLVLPKTAGNIQGAAMVTLNIGATLEGSACTAGAPVSPTSAAWPHLLGARGLGTTQDQNPAARLVWGRQHRDYLSQRELF